MKCTSKLNLTEQYKEHSAKTDKIVEVLHKLPLEALTLLKRVNTPATKQNAS